MNLAASLAVGFATVAALPAFAAAEAGWERLVEQLVHEGRQGEAERLARDAARDPDQAATGHAWLGRISMAGARFEQAAEHFSQAKALGARIETIASQWSQALVRTGRRTDACAVLEEAADAAPQEAGLRYRAGTCFLRLGQPRLALPHIEAAHRNGISHSAALVQLASARFGVGRDDLAVDLLAGLTERGTDPDLLLEIGKLLFRHVLYRQAVRPLRKALEAMPGWYEAGMYLALAHHQLGEYRDCLDVLSGLGLGSKPAEYHVLLGSARARLGQHDMAREELEAAVRMTPERADGYLNLGLFLLDQGDREEAIVALEQAAARNARGAKVLYQVGSRINCRGLSPPDSPATGDASRARLFIELGDTLLAGQQWGAALETYLAALSIDPGAGRPYGGIGLICHELGTPQVGLEFARRGVQLHPRDRELHYYLGALLDYVGEPSEAIRSYETALQLGPPETVPARYWLRLGQVQLATGRAEQAAESYQAALGLEPASSEAHLRLGKLRLSDGDYGEAERLLARAVELDPSLNEAYYAWGLACARNGKVEQSREILEAHRRKLALREAQTGGMGPDRPRR